jgi:nitroreductase
MTDAVSDTLNAIRHVRQVRGFTGAPIDPAALNEILEVARWSGSSSNSQPWRFVVVDDPDIRRQLAEARESNGWIATAPVVIAMVLNGDKKISEAYDEGRVTERIMIAAKLLGLASAVAWYTEADEQARAKAVLGVPEAATLRSVIAIGHPAATSQPSSHGGRKPLDEIVSHNRLGA